MSEKPIIFNGEMVLAILSGRKTQTRRPVRKGVLETIKKYGINSPDLRCPFGQPGDQLWVRETWAPGFTYGGEYPCVVYRADNGGLIGSKSTPVSDVSAGKYGVVSGYQDATAPANTKWKPSIHMPRWASRISLKITDIRVERLLDISEEDAVKEGLSKITKDKGVTWKFGVPDRDGLPGTDDCGWSWTEWETDPRKAFRKLWDSVYVKQGLGTDANPWVWVIEFEKVR